MKAKKCGTNSIGQGETGTQGRGDGLTFLDFRRIGGIREHHGDGLGNLAHFRLLHATRGDRSCADSDTTGLEGASGLVRHRILVGGDVGGIERELALVRARGYARDNEELELGVRCIAAGIRDDTGKLVGIVTM